MEREEGRAQVPRWRAEVPDGAIARVVAASGVGSRTAGEVALLDGAGVRAGALLGGTVDGELAAAAAELSADGTGQRLLDLTIGDAAAEQAGLTCGGHVEVLVQRLADLPGGLFTALDRREAVALVTRVDAPGVLAVSAERADGSLGSEAIDTAAREAAAPFLTHPGAQPVRVVYPDGDLVVEAWTPRPRMVVVGPSALADAIADQCALLGWECTIAGTADEGAAAAAELGPVDALVVLDHDLGTTTAALATALRGGRAYVGALGSRRTQARRRDALTAAGVTEEQQSRIHGPAGLDLGAATPAEIALAITAEALATQRHRPATSLLHSTRPTIH